MGGSAVDAASNFHAAIRAAAKRMTCEESAIKIGAEKNQRAGRKVIPLQVAGPAEGAFLNKKHTYSYGARAAHITVDRNSAGSRSLTTCWCRTSAARLIR